MTIRSTLTIGLALTAAACSDPAPEAPLSTVVAYEGATLITGDGGPPIGGVSQLTLENSTIFVEPDNPTRPWSIIRVTPTLTGDASVVVVPGATYVLTAASAGGAGWPARFTLATVSAARRRGAAGR